MASKKTVTLTDVRREKRLAKNGVNTFETLTLVDTDNTVYSGYVDSNMVVPVIGQHLEVVFQEKTKQNGDVFNHIVKLNTLQEIDNEQH